MASPSVVCPGQTPKKQGAVGSSIHSLMISSACSGSSVGGGVKVGVGVGEEVRVGSGTGVWVAVGNGVGVTVLVGEAGTVKLGTAKDTLTVAVGAEFTKLHPGSASMVKRSK